MIVTVETERIAEGGWEIKVRDGLSFQTKRCPTRASLELFLGDSLGALADKDENPCPDCARGTTGMHTSVCRAVEEF